MTDEAPVGIDLRCSVSYVRIQEFGGLHHLPGYGKLWRRVALIARSPQFQKIEFAHGFAGIYLSDSLAIGVVMSAAELQRFAIARSSGVSAK